MRIISDRFSNMTAGGSPTIQRQRATNSESPMSERASERSLSRSASSLCSSLGQSVKDGRLSSRLVVGLGTNWNDCVDKQHGTTEDQHEHGNAPQLYDWQM
ncbi:hypothetical protein [Methylobacterium sp. WL6]|uniref:hypothetical protein n=1 Tax=Methylobacterium sp. WL6 TaxID=2603901 RepID=UPI0011C7C96A|nr:hypothetical protein [Methylobacterium sp. WL6]TXN67815.1 hypothetical protein FV230_13840 [Methylobacterium sp. WL6]